MKLRKPESWENTALEALATLTLGGDWGKEPEFDSADYTAALCIRGSEFRNWNEDRGRTASLRKVKKTSLASRALRIGDILVEISGGGPDQPVGRTVLIDKISLSHFPNLPKICTNFLRLFRPSGEIDSCYLNLFLQFFYKSGDIRAYQAGSNNLRNLKFDDYLGIEIPIPPFSEQHRIVAKIEELFSELDKGIENLKTAQAQLKVYRQALLKHAFEGKLTAQWRADNPDKLETADALLKRIQKEREQRYQQQVAEWEAGGKQGSKPKVPKQLPLLTSEELAELPDLPGKWVWVRLASVVTVLSGYAFKSTDFVSNGIPVIKIANIGYSEFVDKDQEYLGYPFVKTHKDFVVSPDDFLIALTRPITNNRTKVCRYPKNSPPALLNQRVAALKDSALTPDFLYAFFGSSIFKELIRSKFSETLQPNLSPKDLEACPVPVCALAEQSQISGEIELRLSEVDQLEKTISDALQQADALRQSILKNAFSGQLVPQDPSDEPASALLTRIKAERSAQPTSKKARK